MATSNAHFGEGIGLVALVNVHCSGTEARLADCPLLTIETCRHSDDAGVVCQMQTGIIHTYYKCIVIIIAFRLW